MQQIYDEVKTPFKYGIILFPDEKKMINCPLIFCDRNCGGCIAPATSKDFGKSVLM